MPVTPESLNSAREIYLSLTCAGGLSAIGALFWALSKPKVPHEDVTGQSGVTRDRNPSVTTSGRAGSSRVASVNNTIGKEPVFPPVEEHLGPDDYPYQPSSLYDLYIDYSSDLPDPNMSDAEIYGLGCDTAAANSPSSESRN